MTIEHDGQVDAAIEERVDERHDRFSTISTRRSVTTAPASIRSPAPGPSAVNARNATPRGTPGVGARPAHDRARARW